MIPVPRVSVRNSVRKPISPRAGTRYSIRAQPVPWLTICCIRPLRSASSCVTTPMYSSGTSIATRSTGSCVLPSISRVSTSGLPTVSSKPSRRMISTSTASCSSPRPCTSQTSGLAVGRTRSETLPTSSCSSRAISALAVTLSPSVPASGEVLIPSVIASDGSSTTLTGSGRGSSSVRDRLADRHLGQAGERDDLAGAGLVGGDAVERLGHVELGHARVLDRPVGAAPGDLLALADRPVLDAQQGQPADVGRRVEVRDERLQRVLRVVRGRRHGREQGLDERPEIGGELVGCEAGPPGARVGVDDRELDLRLVGVEVEEELVDLVHDGLGARVGPVDLVHDEDDRKPRLERLAQDEPRLGQRALARVDEEEHAVDHRQAALDLAAEVGVAGRVDDVHLRVADLDGRVLGEDRDALLALEVHRVQHALRDVLVVAERAGLPEQRVDERRLAVVDVRDDRDVP